jgi:hypothetical protein
MVVAIKPNNHIFAQTMSVTRIIDHLTFSMILKAKYFMTKKTA